MSEVTESSTPTVDVNGGTNGASAPDAPPQMLSPESILKAPPDCREELFEVSEWGGWIRLRSPTALASAEIKGASLVFDEAGQVTHMDVAAMERAQMLHGVVEPRLTPEQIAEMQQRFGPSWNRVVAKLDALAGPLGKGGTREAELLKEGENTFR